MCSGRAVGEREELGGQWSVAPQEGWSNNPKLFLDNAVRRNAVGFIKNIYRESEVSPLLVR